MKQSISALLRFLFAVALVEFLDSTARSDVTLTSREERMAFRAYIDAKLLFRGTRLERIAATADYGSLMIFRMNTLLHIYTPHFSPNWEFYKPSVRKLGQT